METQYLADLGYLISAALFIFGLKYLGSPRTAVRGNQLGSMGMLLAVIITVVRMQSADGGVLGWPLIILGLAVGSIVGAVMAKRVEMTSIPEMVALFNGFGGAASALVAASELIKADAVSIAAMGSPGRDVFLVAASAGSIIGWVTLTGSVVAMLKLNGTLHGIVSFAGINAVKLGLLLVAVLLSWVLLGSPESTLGLLGLVVVSCVLGVLFVLPIGGADMPVVISFLNSLSGVAAATTGFVVNNNALIIGGSLVGSAGLILTMIMCKAMNRRFVDVMLKVYGAAADAGTGEKRTVRGYEAEEAALAFDGARSVIIVPGYGMAVSQAQHVVHELAKELQSRGTEVKYAIHPVAGRMPGHMNVLLAESSVPYEQLHEMDEVNPYFAECDVCLVVGANDTVNPAAKSDPGGALGGMPILDVERARTLIIVKRSLSPGYAGVDNDLFYRSATMMLFGDGKEKLAELLTHVKDL